MREHNPAVIRLVAARYNELQGLRTMGDAALVLLGGGGLWGAAVLDDRNVSFGWFALIAVVALLLVRTLRPSRQDAEALPQA